MTFALHALIRETQQHQGLRHDDYQRYRQYCTRKVHRLRDGFKHHHQTKGSKKYEARRVTSDHVKTNVTFLHILLFETERAWAYGMQLRKEATTEPRKTFHSRSRFKKAAQIAEELKELVKTSGLANSVAHVEARAYMFYMRAHKSLEYGDWPQSLKELKSAKYTYATLESAADDHLAALFSRKLEELVPMTRYCEHQLVRNRIKIAETPEDVDRVAGQLEQLQMQMQNAKAFELGDLVVYCENPEIASLLEQPQNLSRAKGMVTVELRAAKETSAKIGSEKSRRRVEQLSALLAYIGLVKLRSSIDRCHVRFSAEHFDLDEIVLGQAPPLQKRLGKLVTMFAALGKDVAKAAALVSSVPPLLDAELGSLTVLFKHFE